MAFSRSGRKPPACRHGSGIRLTWSTQAAPFPFTTICRAAWSEAAAGFSSTGYSFHSAPGAGSACSASVAPPPVRRTTSPPGASPRAQREPRSVSPARRQSGSCTRPASGPFDSILRHLAPFSAPSVATETVPAPQGRQAGATPRDAPGSGGRSSCSVFPSSETTLMLRNCAWVSHVPIPARPRAGPLPSSV